LTIYLLKSRFYILAFIYQVIFNPNVVIAQELEIKLEDFLLVSIAQIFTTVDWDILSNSPKSMQSSSSEKNLVYSLLVAENILGSFSVCDDVGISNGKIIIKWLLLCPIKMNITFTSTADRSLIRSMVSVF